MASGKSTLAQALALSLNLPIIDLDVEIEKYTGQTIAENVFNKGELFLRKTERAQLENCLKQEKFVMATGGGTPCYYDNMDLINANSLSIYLKMNLADLHQRLEGEQRTRPLISHLKGQELKEFIAKHLFERQVFYERAIFQLPAKVTDTQERVNTIKKLLL